MLYIILLICSFLFADLGLRTDYNIIALDMVKNVDKILTR